MTRGRLHRLLLGILAIGGAGILGLLCFEHFGGRLPWFSKGSRSSPLDELGLEILPREAWRARDQAEPTGQLGKPSRITIHHQGGAAFLKEDQHSAMEEIRSIQNDHQRRRGWADIGYHFIIDPAGRIWEGRPAGDLGAHAGNAAANQGNLGIVLLGNFDLQTLNPAQEDALSRLVDRLRDRWIEGGGQLLTHNEIRQSSGEGSTSCPGKHLADWVARRRSIPDKAR